MYLTFLLERSKGEVQTGAKFIRDFVLNHKDYRKDSVVGGSISFDLMSTIINMNSDPEERGKLLGKKWQNY
jgi:glutamate--cysteine ligase catalytic subunit